MSSLENSIPIPEGVSLAGSWHGGCVLHLAFCESTIDSLFLGILPPHMPSPITFLDALLGKVPLSNFRLTYSLTHIWSIRNSDLWCVINRCHLLEATATGCFGQALELSIPQKCSTYQSLVLPQLQRTYTKILKWFQWWSSQKRLEVMDEGLYPFPMVTGYSQCPTTFSKEESLYSSTLSAPSNFFCSLEVLRGSSFSHPLLFWGSGSEWKPSLILISCCWHIFICVHYIRNCVALRHLAQIW